MFDTYGVGAAAAMPALWLDLRGAQLDEGESELAQIVAQKQLARRNRIRQYEGQPVGARTDDLAGNGETDLRGSGDKTKMYQEAIDVDPAILLGDGRPLRQEREDLQRDPQIAPQRRHPKVQFDERLFAPGADLVGPGAKPGRRLETSLLGIIAVPSLRETALTPRAMLRNRTARNCSDIGRLSI